MKKVAYVLFCIGLGTAQPQQGPAAPIESRQLDVSRLASLYFIDLSRGDWKHQQFYPCPAFTHHVFARYERSAAPGVISSFVAIFPSNAPTNGKTGILLIPAQTFAPDSPNIAERRTTQIAFNRVWSGELNASGHPDRFPALDWEGLAECYALISGEQPAHAKPVPVPQPAPSIDLKANIVSGIGMSVDKPAAQSQYLYLTFDTHGMIAGVTLK